MDGGREHGALAEHDPAFAALSAYFEQARIALTLADAGDDQLRLILASRGFLSLTGYTWNAIRNSNCRFLQRDLRDQPGLERVRRYFADPAQRSVRVPLINFRADGSAFVNMLSLAKLSEHSGRVVYHFASQFDITRARPEQLRAYDALLGVAFRQGGPMNDETGSLLQGSITALADTARAIAEGKMLVAGLDLEH